MQPEQLTPESSPPPLLSLPTMVVVPSSSTPLSPPLLKNSSPTDLCQQQQQQQQHPTPPASAAPSDEGESDDGVMTDDSQPTSPIEQDNQAQTSTKNTFSLLPTTTPSASFLKTKNSTSLKVQSSTTSTATTTTTTKASTTITAPSTSSASSLPSPPSHITPSPLLSTSLETTTTTTTTRPNVIKTQQHQQPQHLDIKKRIPTKEVIRQISDLVDGRDKTIKLVQYFCKVILWWFFSHNPKRFQLLSSRMKSLAKQLSTTRKVLRLGHFVEPLSDSYQVLAGCLQILGQYVQQRRKRTISTTLIHEKQQQLSSSSSSSGSLRNQVRTGLGNLNTILGFCQDISDDIYCLGVIGVLDRSFTDKAEPVSNNLWMVGVSIDLHENFQSIWDTKQQMRKLVAARLALTKEEEDLQQGEQDVKMSKEYKKLEAKLHWLQVTSVKLAGDFLFCAYDVFHGSFSDGFQATTGFVSGIAGAYKFVGKLIE